MDALLVVGREPLIGDPIPRAKEVDRGHDALVVRDPDRDDGGGLGDAVRAAGDGAGDVGAMQALRACERLRHWSGHWRR